MTQILVREEALAQTYPAQEFLGLAPVDLIMRDRDTPDLSGGIKEGHPATKVVIRQFIKR